MKMVCGSLVYAAFTP
ncbi:hypothetical protein M2G61_21330 [Vibrio vulnificus]|nr:hypothetical protein [Vibrio vulnificus]MCU8457240.1 hypothetical protein [Vibrio vulnificus]